MNISKSIFKGCLQNKRKSQEALYHAFYPHLKRIAVRYVLNEDDAAAVVNKTMLKVFTELKTFKGDETNLGGWARRIAVNASIDLIRQKKRFTDKHATVEFINELEGAPSINIDEKPEHILKLLDALPAKASAVFNLFVIEGYSHKEIAALLEISEANSKWNLHYARKQLKLWIVEKELI